MQTILTATIGNQLFPVSRLTRAGIHFHDWIGEDGRDATVLLHLDADGIGLEIPATGRIESTSDGHLLHTAFSDVQMSAIETFLKSNDGMQRQSIAQVLYTQGTTPHIVRKANLVAISLAGALSLALMAAITHLQIIDQSSLPARAAVIATTAAVLESSASGKVQHLTKSGPIKIGEVYAAVRTSAGRTVFLEASASGTLQNATFSSDVDVTKGSPLVYVSNPSDQFFVKAYLSTASAAKLTNGYRAEMRTSDSTGSWVLIAESLVASEITRDFQFTDSVGNPLAEVNLPARGVSGLTPGQRVKVRFTRSLLKSLSLQALEVGNSLQSWLRTGGVKS
jgi:hypothetical protein